jgi:hypothetical protein
MRSLHSLRLFAYSKVPPTPHKRALICIEITFYHLEVLFKLRLRFNRAIIGAPLH